MAGRRGRMPVGEGDGREPEVGGEEKREMRHGWLGRISVRGKTVLGARA